MSYYPGRSHKSRHALAFFLLIVGVGLTVALFYVKTKAQSARSEIALLEHQVQIEVDAINVLRAEISYLESPARLGRLAERQLGLVPVKTDRIILPADIALHFDIEKQRTWND